jgi:hypothetical protein
MLAAPGVADAEPHVTATAASVTVPEAPGSGVLNLRLPSRVVPADGPRLIEVER